MRYAIVHKGKVLNVIEWDGKSKYKPDEGKLVKVENLDVAPGYNYANGKFVEPAGESNKSKSE